MCRKAERFICPAGLQVYGANGVSKTSRGHQVAWERAANLEGSLDGVALATDVIRLMEDSWPRQEPLGKKS